MTKRYHTAEEMDRRAKARLAAAGFAKECSSCGVVGRRLNSEGRCTGCVAAEEQQKELLELQRLAKEEAELEAAVKEYERKVAYAGTEGLWS